MKFIALRSLHKEGVPDPATIGEPRYDADTEHGRTVDEDEETGLRYVNPSLIIPLEEMWVAKKGQDESNRETGDGDEEGDGNV